MLFKIYSDSAAEPVTLAEVKEQLRLDSSSVANNLAPAQSIAPGSHVIAAAYSLKGSGVSVAGYGALVLLEAGTNGSGGTIDAKIQEADTDTDLAYTDWAGGAFAQVTTANDNATHEKAYTGTKPYIRVVATVAVAACEFGVSVILQGQDRSDDAYLTALIAGARKHIEDLCGPLVTQTWDAHLDAWPGLGVITIEKPRLLTVTGITYTDSEAVAHTFAASNYRVDTIPHYGRIVLTADADWPGDVSEYYEINPIAVRFTCGFGAAASNVPDMIRLAVRLLVQEMYENRDKPNMDVVLPLIANWREWGW